MFTNHKPIKWGRSHHTSMKEKGWICSPMENMFAMALMLATIHFYNVSTKSQKWKYIISVHLFFATFRIGKS